MDLIENQIASNLIKRHPWELARYDFIEERVKEMYNSFETNKVSIVDIGCGDAYVITRLSKTFLFNKVFAIDINFNNDLISSLSKKNSSINFLKSIEEVKFELDTSYIFLMNDVIEHIEKDNDFLINLKQKTLTDIKKFYFFISVPSFDLLFSQHDLDLGHYRRYNLSKLLNYNNILNLKVTNKGYFFINLLLLRSFSKLNQLLFKKATSKIGVSEWKRGQLITRIIYLFLKFDISFNKIFNNKIPGLSCYIIFNRNE
jgi:hypothetical protein